MGLCKNPYRIEEIDSKMRIPEDGYLNICYYEETVIIPFDTTGDTSYFRHRICTGY